MLKILCGQDTMSWEEKNEKKKHKKFAKSKTSESARKNKKTL